MASPPLRIIQWATGNTGVRALREVVRDPMFELVGVRVFDPAKEGKDAGELCGEAATGIKATTDRSSLLALDADCVIYTPTATGSGETRAGLSEEEVVEDVVAMTGSGKSIVTSCTDFFGGGLRFREDHRARILDACKKSGASIYATGSDPGFITEMVPLAFLSIQRSVELIEIEEYGDLRFRPSPYMILEQMRYGKPLSEFNPDRRMNHLFGEYKLPLNTLAGFAGLNVEEWTAEGGCAAARHDETIVAGEIKAGTAGAQRVIIRGLIGGKDVIRFIQYSYVTLDLDPDWEMRPSGWRLKVLGDSPMTIDIAYPLDAPGSLARIVPAINANGLVNAIPYVCAAPPGFLTAADIPHVLPTSAAHSMRR